jgi:UPF0716 family protein affecting phage T7 exclusion
LWKLIVITGLPAFRQPARRVESASGRAYITLMKGICAGDETMLAGIILIMAGILLVVFPPLLSIIVAAFLIFAGVMAISVARYNRKYQRHFDNPTIEFFFRY